MTIGNNILSLLYEHDISQKQMAIDLDIAPSTLNGYINNRREPDYATLLRFARYFHVSCDYLLGNAASQTSKLPASDSSALPFPLDKQEIRLLSYYKTLTPDQMELVMAQVQLMYRQNNRAKTTEESGETP